MKSTNMMMNILEGVPIYKSVGTGSRPALADHQKVGFFSLDRCSQTDISEIVDLKEMTEVLQVLLQDVAGLRRDIKFTKHVMQADYEAKLRDKSLDLYCRINERVSELEKVHEDRVNTIRKAFRQQLADALARVSIMYNKNMESKMSSARKKQDSDAGRLDMKYREMQATIQRNESVIHMLKLQLSQYQQKSSMLEESLMEDESMGSKSPGHSAEAQDLRDEIARMEKKIDRMEEALDIREEETAQLNKEVETLTEQLEKEKMMVEQLQHEKEQVKGFADQDKASARRLLEKQKLEFERLMEERIRQAKEEAENAAAHRNKGLSGADKDKMQLLQDQKKLLEEQLTREKAKNAGINQEQLDAEKMRRNEQRMKDEIQRLKKEIERVHRTWEKKFAILQQSLHALKDESYLRQTLQRQAAALHQASVSYATDTPVGIRPTNNNTSSSSKKPLPDIPKTGKSSGRGGSVPGDKDYISYTVSAPSGRGTAMFSVDENQVMSDSEQDLPADIIPLPDPPARRPTECGEDSRPSTQSRIVILPSVQAQ